MALLWQAPKCQKEKYMKIGFVSLGCSKNLVDTEKTIGIFKANNYEIVNSPMTN